MKVSIHQNGAMRKMELVVSLLKNRLEMQNILSRTHSGSTNLMS